MVRRALRTVVAGLLPALSACGRQEAPPAPPRLDAPAAPQAAVYQPPHVDAPVVTVGTVTRIESRDRVGLTGPRVDAKPGDWLVETPDDVAVVSADGRILDLGPRGGRDEITSIDPTLFLGLDAAHLEVVSIEPVSDGHALHVLRRALEKPLFLHVFVSFAGDRLRVETAATLGAPSAAALAVTLGERVGWGNVPTWVEGQGFMPHGGTYGTEFLARESFGVAYALCSEGGRMIARFDGGDGGFYEGASTGELPANLPLDAPSARRVITIAHAVGSLGKAAAACTARTPAFVVKAPTGLPKDAHVELAHCPTGGRAPATYTRFFADEADIPVPQGCFTMRLTAPGHAASAWFDPAALPSKTLPPAGRIHFSVTDKRSGRPLPARLLVRGVKGTPDPDWGDDPDAGAALNVVYSETGEGERPVPPGKYAITLDRGFEYTALEKDVEIVAGKSESVSAELDRVVDTRGFIAADLHLHAAPSPDAPQPLADRVRALVATGVEVGVATDHNKVTDYRPVIRELNVTPYLASIVGDEITTRDPAYGHFNAFPLNAGAEPLPYRGIAPRAIFSAAHAAGPLAPETIVQVNHPRMGGIGYFEILRFDRDDPAGWAKRVSLADTSFDAIEVFNGDHYARLDRVEDVLLDWYALLNAGYRITATGNSDSHKLTFHEPGVPRNLVAVPNDDPASLDERAFVAAVRKGKVVVSSGPFIRVDAGGKGVGESVPAGSIAISIVVDAPPWVDVDRVELVRRGEVVGTWSSAASGAKPPPGSADPFQKGPHRFELHTTRELAKGDWIVAIARGSKPMSYLYRAGAKPFAFTNPIWVE